MNIYIKRITRTLSKSYTRALIYGHNLEQKQVAFHYFMKIYYVNSFSMRSSSAVISLGDEPGHFNIIASIISNPLPLLLNGQSV